MSILSKRFIDVFDRHKPMAFVEVELESDEELNKFSSECLDRGHAIYTYSNPRNASYGHLCKTCGKYFHRHMCLDGRGSSIGVR